MKKNPLSPAGAASPSPPVETGFAEAAGDDLQVAWRAAFSLLAVLLLVLLWFPLARIPAHYTITMNEGINAYYEHVTGSGGKVYGHPPKYEYANYPPVFFHLIGWLGSLTGDVTVTGRWVSLLAYFAIAVFASLIVYRLGNSRRLAAYAGLCWLIWLCAFEPGRVGFNDMHLLGVAVSLAGLYCFVCHPDRTRWLCASAALFSLSLFTKQSLVAFPAAVALQLLPAPRKRLAIWLATAIASCSILLLLTLAVDGRYFFTHLMLPRLYYPGDIVNSLSTYLYFIQGAFVAACIWMLRKREFGRERVLVAAFFIAHAFATFLLGWAGASLNHLTEAMVATAMMAALAIPAAERIVRGSRFPRAGFTLLLILPFFLTSILVLPQRIPSDLSRYAKEIPESEAEFAYVSKFISAQPGPALCETLLLCYAAGKPEEYDSFAADEAMRTGTLPMAEVLQLVESRHFRVIQIEYPATQPMQPAARIRFPGPFMRLLFAKYKLAFRTKWYAVFVPSEG
jgi:Dolichyl-phosphate-mannose-protein mannosyltransferase